ncbi:unnamed protein product, partial [Phaeothamnion confervicola]
MGSGASISGGNGSGGVTADDATDARYLLRSLRDAEDADIFLQILLPAYALLPESDPHCHLQRARAAFAAGLLAAVTRKADLTESLHLEAVLALDRAPPADAAAAVAPLLSPLGVHGLERLGDALLRNGKYEYGVLALERAVDCFWEVKRRAAEHDKLIRKVTRITLEHDDIRRAVEYHVKMLRRARKGGNVNEFVYLAKEISRMLVEQGAFLDAEPYLKVASRLVSGTPMTKVLIRDRQPAVLGKGGALTSAAAAAAPPQSATTATASSKGKGKAAVAAASAGSKGSGGGNGGSGGGGLAGEAESRSLVGLAASGGGGGASSAGPMGPLGQLSADGQPECGCGCRDSASCRGFSLSPRNRKLRAGTMGSLTFSCEERLPESNGCSVATDRSNLSTPTSLVGGAVMETQQYELQMKLVDVFCASLQHEKALKTLGSLLKRRIPAQQRPAVLLRMAECYLKVLRLGSCEAALERVILEADEALDQQGNGRNAGGDGGGSSTPGGGGGGGVGAGNAVESVQFLVLRAKCRLAAGDAPTALHWATLALSLCSDARHATLVGRLHHLQGRCFQAMLNVRMAEEAVRRDWTAAAAAAAAAAARTASSGAGGGGGGSSTQEELAGRADDAFMTAQGHYRATDDVYYQAKCLARAVEMQLGRVFPDVAVRGLPLDMAA